MDLIKIFVYILLLGWFAFSVNLLLKAKEKLRPEMSVDGIRSIKRMFVIKVFISLVILTFAVAAILFIQFYWIKG